MKVIIGLGNPGPQYVQTRHNVGFMAVEELARRHGASKPRIKFEAEIAEVPVGSEKMLLVAPQTYMNRSGRTARKIVDFYELTPGDLLVICDDMNLDSGRIRLRPAGSAGGQKGLVDIISHLGTQEFPRLRIGIGRPPGEMTATNYVLGRFSKREAEDIEAAVRKSADAAETWVREGISAAMSRYNVGSAGTGSAERETPE